MMFNNLAVNFSAVQLDNFCRAINQGPGLPCYRFTKNPSSKIRQYLEVVLRYGLQLSMVRLQLRDSSAAQSD